jgi:hypothetical protein
MKLDYDNDPAKQTDDPKSNPAHIARFPKGYQRNEEAERRKDGLAEKIAADAENAGSINSDALKPEREILHHLDPHTGDWPISNRQPGRYYIGVHKDNISINNARLRGFQPVQGDDPEGVEFKGADCAGGSSLRGCGDVLLYWCPAEIRQDWEEANIRKGIAVGAIDIEEGPEMQWADEANDPRSVTRQLGAMAHARRNDPKLQQTIFRGTAGQIERLNQGIREGNLPNFEMQMRRPTVG